MLSLKNLDSNFTISSMRVPWYKAIYITGYKKNTIVTILSRLFFTPCTPFLLSYRNKRCITRNCRLSGVFLI